MASERICYHVYCQLTTVGCASFYITFVLCTFSLASSTVQADKLARPQKISLLIPSAVPAVAVHQSLPLLASPHLHFVN